MTPVDVTGWEPADEEFLGTKPKQWVRDPDQVLWLWKESTIQHDLLHGDFRKGDDWAEVIAGRVGEALVVPVAHVQLAIRGDRFGVISRSVLADDSEILVHGNELLSEGGRTASDPHDRMGYTVGAVELALHSVSPPVGSDVSLRSALDSFVGYLLLDALVGNTDRHQDNWATIRSPAGRWLAPSFDHASSLGFQLSDGERLDRLAGQGRTVEDYGAAAVTKFEGRPSTFTVAAEALDRVDRRVRAHWIDVILGAPAGLEEILEEVPPDRMTGAARRFAQALYERNRAFLSHHLRTMGS